MSRSKRRADGTLRPTVQRHRQRRHRAERAQKVAAMTPERQAERQAWLANFEPGARRRFFTHIRLADTIFLRPYAAELGVDQAEAAPILEELGNQRGWRKLRTLDGTVIAIAPDRKSAAA